MSEPFLGEIKIISWNFAPKGWTFCNGQLLPINQNQALFSILGTTYGGNGQTNFALPNFQGRVPIHMGNSFTIGQVGGATAVTLNIQTLPAHTHAANAGGASNVSTAAGNFPAVPSGGLPLYGGATPDTTMNAGCGLPTGGSQPHENMSPYLVLNFIIALQGIFPSRN